MTNKRGRSFEVTLTALALGNAQTLGHKASAAASLAVAYPENEGAFRAIEARAIVQIARILGWEPWTADILAVIGRAPQREPVGAILVAD